MLVGLHLVVNNKNTLWRLFVLSPKFDQCNNWKSQLNYTLIEVTVIRPWIKHLWNLFEQWRLLLEHLEPKGCKIEKISCKLKGVVSNFKGWKSLAFERIYQWILLLPLNHSPCIQKLFRNQSQVIFSIQNSIYLQNRIYQSDVLISCT